MRFTRPLLAIFLSLHLVPNYQPTLPHPTGAFAVTCSPPPEAVLRPRFSLVRRCQRSRQKLVSLANARNLEECVRVARRARGLALNYAPVSRRRSHNRLADPASSRPPGPRFDFASRRRHFWLQPEEFFNCHVLECPENATFATMASDSRFDYFSLYGRAPVSNNYTCVPEVGLFQLVPEAAAYANASRLCRPGSLAHVASPARTAALARLLAEHNARLREGTRPTGASVREAFVGLRFNRSLAQLPPDFVTPADESLGCFRHRAWAPGHPRRGGAFANASCVALTAAGAWRTVDCGQRLPFVCEIQPSRADAVDPIDASRPDECPQDFK